MACPTCPECTSAAYYAAHELKEAIDLYAIDHAHKWDPYTEAALIKRLQSILTLLNPQGKETKNNDHLNLGKISEPTA